MRGSYEELCRSSRSRRLHRMFRLEKEFLLRLWDGEAGRAFLLDFLNSFLRRMAGLMMVLRGVHFTRNGLWMHGL